MYRASPIVLAATAALLLPAASHAATAEVQDGMARYTADPGERNIVSVGQSAAGVEFTEVGERGADIRPGAGCATTDGRVTCTGAQAVAIALGDADDLLCIGHPMSVPVTYSGGPGIDRAELCDVNLPATMDNDDVADDGPDRRHDVGPDVEVLAGSRNVDRLGTGAAGGQVYPHDGDDTVHGGIGPDTIVTAFVEDVGTDSGAFFAEGRDTVRCGAGQDLVLADRDDVLAADCEARAKPAGGVTFLFVGSSGRDRLVGPYGWAPARMLGRGGGDWIEVPAAAFTGRSHIDGGTGDDRLLDGPSGNPIAAYGGTGRDAIVMRDKSAGRHNRDHIHCGSGFDRVYSDRFDRVSRDCERVTRGRPPASLLTPR